MLGETAENSGERASRASSSDSRWRAAAFRRIVYPMSEVKAYVAEAEIVLNEGCDPAAVGAAVTVELCGHWEHEGACRWPHNSAIWRIASRRCFGRCSLPKRPGRTMSERGLRGRCTGAKGGV